MHIAVVGSGIAGLGAAWALSRHHEVTVFEAEPRLGGHANTVDLELDGRQIAVDTGFIVYNLRTYPHLIRLFEHLGVPTEASNMSFAVSLGSGRLEYAGSPRGLFAQKRNFVRPGHWTMIRDVLRFYRDAPKLLQLPPDAPAAAQTLGDYLRAHRYGRSFVYDHLLPMAAAIWSCPVERMLAFPMRSFVRFCDNHGLLLLRDRPQWRTVTGGSRAYVRRVAAGISGPIRLATPVRALARDPAGVSVLTDGGAERFDQVVLATHGDRALQLLGQDADARERAILGAFGYEPNRAVLHTDPRLMPARRAVWSSWNYLGDGAHADDAKVSVSYWMNSLQNLTGSDLFVSLNPLQEPEARCTVAEFSYDHPVFDTAALDAQARLPEIQGVRRTWFCGSYCGYGFHEDGLEAGFAVAAALGAPAPWWESVAPASPAAEIAAGMPAPAAAVAGIAAE
jgi:hypothetical protein